MEAATLSPPRPPAAPPLLLEGAAARATSLLTGHERQLRRTARRFAGSSHDAEDAYQRAVEILLTRGPAIEPPRLLGWMQVVIRREAMRVRRSHEALRTDPSGLGGLDDDEADFTDLVSRWAGPVEALDRREWVSTAAARLGRLKPDERRALVLQAAGYSYDEIAEMSDWTYTKVNRLLSEGRARLRSLGVRLE